MTAEWDKSTNLILEKLQVAELRMQEIEVRNLALIKFHATFLEFQKKFSEKI
jgi:hypothetical protein